MAIRIAQYKGKGIGSKAIKLLTWGQYSHTAIMLEDDLIVEAWEGSNSVRIINSISDGHKPGTPVDIYYIDVSAKQEGLIREFVLAQVGKEYDYWGIHGFLWRKQRQCDESWFCSELFGASCEHASVRLFNNVPPWRMSPSMASRSPVALRIESTVTT